jgi:hypothetical protein
MRNILCCLCFISRVRLLVIPKATILSMVILKWGYGVQGATTLIWEWKLSIRRYMTPLFIVLWGSKSHGNKSCRNCAFLYTRCIVHLLVLVIFLFLKFCF